MYRIVNINGNNEIVSNKDDVYNLMEQYMGQEAREIAEETIEGTELIASVRDDAELYKEERDGYEAEVESNQRAFQDIQDEIDYLANMERFSRKAILEAIKNIQTIINNQI